MGRKRAHSTAVSDNLRKWILASDIASGEVIDEGVKNHNADVLSVYKNHNSFSNAVWRFYRGGNINVRNRQLVEKIAHSVLANRLTFTQRIENNMDENKDTLDKLADDYEATEAELAEEAEEERLAAEVDRQLGLGDSVAEMPCPTCGQLAPIQINPDFTWEISK